ncbi:hypothetical protein KCQ_05481 [Pectobacterium atrosepticum ICMP 1526]|uniref:hypothetical protein n=1 Tax=Pectobacterium atrosepticum TaxID=29471 RepID=UPI00065D83E2|nr:hypothetical protein [Pectobacterium atrosepticum]KMK87235.1 hypothetical protein KCQ_05481 [Pectobacterium atrosepticum ICMP 1526]
MNNNQEQTDGNMINSFTIPSGLSGQQMKKDSEQAKADFVKKLKRAYIDHGIKINDDDPIIAVLIGQEVLIDIYQNETLQYINNKFDILEKSLNTFPVRVNEELNERAESFLNMVQQVDSKAEKHFDDELSNFQKKVSDFANNAEIYLKSQQLTHKEKPKEGFSKSDLFKIYIGIFGFSFLGIGAALVLFYFMAIR